MKMKSFSLSYSWSETDMQMKHQYYTTEAVTKTQTRFSGVSGVINYS